MTETRMKQAPDAENEIQDVRTFSDTGRCRVTPVAQFEPDVARAITDTLMSLVRRAHNSPVATSGDEQGIVRAQEFEEGDVFMLESPFEGYFADRYLMDFYNVEERDICSRMHLHTGLRFVRMMTGPDTVIRTSSLSQFEVTHVEGVTDFQLELFTDPLPDAPADGPQTRYNVIVPPNSWVDVQIPRGVSHQFNAIGPHAVIDSVHPEESIETLREQMSGFKMMAQTVFLAESRPSADSCIYRPEPSVPQ